MRRAAFKGFAADGAGEIDDDAVAVLRGAFDAVEAGALLAQDFDGFFHFGIADGGVNLFDFLCGEVADFYFGEHFKHAGKTEVFRVVLAFDAFEAGHAGDFPAFGKGGVEKRFLRQLVHDVVLDACAVHGLNHAQRGFAGAEAVDAGAAGGLFQAFVAFGVDGRPGQGEDGFAFEIVQRF